MLNMYDSSMSFVSASPDTGGVSGRSACTRTGPAAPCCCAALHWHEPPPAGLSVMACLLSYLPCLGSSWRWLCCRNRAEERAGVLFQPICSPHAVRALQLLVPRKPPELLLLMKEPLHDYNDALNLLGCRGGWAGQDSSWTFQLWAQAGPPDGGPLPTFLVRYEQE